MATAVENATNVGLNAAQYDLNALRNQSYNTPYPQQQGPAAYVANKGYQSLTGGDYDAMQKAYTGQVDQAYNQGVGQMKNMFGANGMYGSVGGSGGLMSGAMGALNQAKMTGYNDALTQRYGMQQQDAQNTYTAGVADATRRQGYNQSVIDFNNQNALNQYQNRINMQDRAFNNSMALATGSMPGYSAQIQGDAATKAANTAGMWSAGGALAGGLMGSDGFWDLFS